MRRYSQNVVFLLVFLVVGTIAFNPDDPDEPFILGEHLSTKSPYFALSNSSSQTSLPGCKPIFLNFVARHGARQPSGGDIKALEDLQTFVQQNAAKLNGAKYPWLPSWKTPYTEDQSQDLAAAGELQLYDLAQRLANNYPEIFNASIDMFHKSFIIRTSEVERTSRSGNSFALGLFENKGILGPARVKSWFSFTHPKDTDRELRFFKACPPFVKDVLDNDATYTQSELWLDKHTPAIAARISADIGVNITKEQVDSVWKACAWEFALTNESSHWCSLLQKEDFLAFEYREDLKFFYESGYGGSSLGYDIACPLLKNMIDLFDAKINGDEDHKFERARLRFGHAETIVPFLVMMDIFNDSVRYDAQTSMDLIKKRSWRSSMITPFAGNIMIMLYNCSERNDGVAYRVKLIHNEREFHSDYPECQGELYCDYNKFKQHFENQELACNFNQLCGFEPKPSPTPAIVGAIVGAITLVIGVAVGFFGGWRGKHIYESKKAYKQLE